MYSNKEDMNLKGSGASKKLEQGRTRHETPWAMEMGLIGDTQWGSKSYNIRYGKGKKIDIEIVYSKNWRKQFGAFICVPIFGSIPCDFMRKLIWLIRLFSEDLCKGTPGATPSNQSLPLLTKCQSFVPLSLLFSDWNLDDFAHIAVLEQQTDSNWCDAPQCWAKRTKNSPALGSAFFDWPEICWWMIHIVMFSVSFLGAKNVYT